MSNLAGFVDDIARARVRVVDLTQTLSPDFPTLVLPPQFGQCAPFAISEISRYDERGGGEWYWNNFSCSEHTGTHFDAPIHWVTGRDRAHNSVDTIDPRDFIAGACVIDCSREAAANEDFVLTVPRIEAWENEHGKIPPRSWVLFRTDWPKLHPGSAYPNRRQDGAHTPGPSPEAVKFLLDERDMHGFGVEFDQHRRRPGPQIHPAEPGAFPHPRQRSLRTAVSVQPRSASLHRRSRRRGPAEDQAGLGQSAAGARDRAVSQLLDEPQSRKRRS